MTAAVHPFTASARPWLTSGIALVGAGAIALAPISPVSPLAPVRDLTPTVSAQAQLAALEWPYILSLPIVRQYVVNQLEVWAVWLGGFAQAGVGLVQSLLTIPGVTVETIQQLLALDFVGAFETVTGAIRDGVVAVGEPLVNSWVWRNARAGAVTEALSTALPQAIVAEVNGVLTAANVVTVSFITGAQGLVQAVLTFNLGNIVDAGIEGTRNFIISLGTGARAIIDGIEEGQRLITEALAVRPASELGLAAKNSVADISALRNPVGESTSGLAKPFKAVTLDTNAPAPKPAAAPVVADVATETPATPEVAADNDVSPADDISDEDTTPAKPVRANPVKDLADQVEKSVEKLNTRVKAEQAKAEDAVKKVADRIKARVNDAGQRAANKHVAADAG